jgi:uncharacterized protein YdaU (DUF1376 family)
MPLYIGDYLADTIGLTHAQHGAYLLAIMAYWRKAGPLSDAEARSIMGEQAESLSRFFQITPDGWRSKRSDLELAASQQNSDRNKARTAAATKARIERNVDVTKNVTFTPSPSPSPSPSPISKSIGRFASPSFEEVKLNGAKIGLPDAECEKFLAYYESNGWRVGKNPMRSWPAAMINWRGNWQERNNNGKSNQTNRGNSKENPRNAHTCATTTDFSTAPERATARLEQKMAEARNRESAAAGESGTGGIRVLPSL